MKKKILFIILLFSFINIVNAEEIKLGTYKIYNANDETKMLVENNSNIELGNEESTGEKEWDIYANDSYFYIKSHKNNELSLDVSGGSRRNGTNIQIYQVNNTVAQKWILNYAGNSYYYITSLMGNYNIDVSGGRKYIGVNIQLYQNNGTNAQKWKLVRINNDEKPLEDGKYSIIAHNNNKNVIDLSNGNSTNGSNIRIYTSNNTWAQIWNLTYKNGYYVINSILNDKKVFDIANGSLRKSSNIQIYNSNDTIAQKFIIVKNADETYSIRTYDGIFTLDISGGSTKSGTNLQLYIPNGTKAQKFSFEKVLLSDIETGYYNINSLLSDDKVIGVNNKALSSGKNVDLREKTDNNYTKWYIKRLERDIYSIHNADNLKLVLDVSGNNKNNGANIQLYTSNNTSAQKWIIRKNDDDTYKFIGVGSNKVIDISGANSSIGTNIQIYEDNGTIAQKFKITPTEVSEHSREYEDGKYIIKSMNTNKVLDISGASKANGTNVQIYSLNNTKAQIWKVTYEGDGEYIISSLINPRIVLTSDGDNVVSSKNVNTNNQRWFFDKNGDNTLIINKATGKYLSINNGNVISTDNIQDASKFSLASYNDTITYKGIDVSKHNGNIDWGKVASSVDFVIIRAGFADETFLSNGVDKYEDVNYIKNVEGCEKYNIPYALYFYSYANKVNNADRPSYNKINGESAESEASHMLNLLKKTTNKGYYPTMNTAIYFDQEDDSILAKTKDKNVLTGMINKFCGIMNNNGHKCGVYASKYWFTDRINVKEVADKHSIWVAQWPGYNSFDNAVSSKSSYTTTPHKLWQFSSEGRINGISTYVDLDLGYNIFE